MLFFREAQAAERRRQADFIEGIAQALGVKNLKGLLADLRRD